MHAQKIVVYQILPRLFGNINQTKRYYGTIAQNGCGKFGNINQKALASLHQMGITHVWYTGIIEHASMNDYSAYDIKPDDADVVKGRAGSPYAIKDYYDVDPDLAMDVKNRMAEFEALIRRTHDAGMKVIIDFVPNHVARGYNSDAKPNYVSDLGERDNKDKAFDVHNNFYYLPNQQFIVPPDYDPLGNEMALNEDQVFEEYPAKATGNDVFKPTPSKDDWFETVKLNYGVDIMSERKTYFDSLPRTWKMMTDILEYWAAKGVDGFRCDMAEMVPVQFWNYAITRVKSNHPNLIFISEIYNPNAYQTYLTQGKFDYLYDKVGLYDAVKRLIQNKGNTEDITRCWKTEQKDISDKMYRFMENHDEQRISSADFAGSPQQGYGAMVLSATLGSGPIMIYNGQETGEQGLGVEGFGGEDGRTSIFDYWTMSSMQGWINQYKYDGYALADDEKKVREFYAKLLTICNKYESIYGPNFYDLQTANRANTAYKNMYSFLRYTTNECLLICVNFSDTTYTGTVTLPASFASQLSGLDNSSPIDLLSNQKCSYRNGKAEVKVLPKQAQLIKIY
ncbi:MAG: alpha-amylase family protein [Bacteroidetes bacterium]|nr:alpha-amylase family protein [Bacteroidota bacterium]